MKQHTPTIIGSSAFFEGAQSQALDTPQTFALQDNGSGALECCKQPSQPSPLDLSSPSARSFFQQICKDYVSLPAVQMWQFGLLG